MSEAAKSGLARDEDWAHRRKLAILCRIAGQHGLIGIFGHISLRIPGTDLVLVTPGAGAEKTAVRADQIFVFALDGTILHHPGGGRDTGAVTDGHVIGDAGPAAKRHIVAHEHAAGYPGVGGQKAIAAKPDVVAHVNQVIEL